MRFIPGTVLAIVTVVALVTYRGFGSTEPSPDRDFLELELAAADANATGTCFSLSTVLIANTLGYSNAVVSWHRVATDTWTRRSEELVPSPRGPSVMWQSYTFKRVEDRIVPIAYDSAPGPVASLAGATDALLQAPHERRSTRIERCLNGGAGYKPAR